MNSQKLSRTTVRVGAPVSSPQEGLPRLAGVTRVLLIEQDEALRLMLERHLRTLERFEVVATREAQEALDRLLLGHFDLVLVSLQLTGISSPHLLKALTMAHPSPIVVWMSETSQPAELTEEAENIISHVLAVPCTRSRVTEVVSQAIYDQELRRCRSLVPETPPEHVTTGEPWGEPPQAKAPRLATYELRERLGEKNNGVVYRAQDLSRDKPVVLRAIPRARLQLNGPPDLWWERFAIQVRSLAPIEHPALASVIEAGLEPDEQFVFVVSEQAQGVPLQRRLQDGPLPVEQVYQVMSASCMALATVDDANLVHHLVTDGNLFLADNGLTTLTDFGLAELLALDYLPFEQKLCQHRFWAPEQLRCTRSDDRADQFSLGLIFHEALTGSSCFPQQSGRAYATAVLQGEFQFRLPADLPGREIVRSILHTMLAPSPSRRYSSFRELHHALHDWYQAFVDPPPPLQDATDKRKLVKKGINSCGAK